jgi:hypothetical protein
VALLYVWEQRTLKCPETKMWSAQFSAKRWLNMNEEFVYTNILNCTNKIQIKNIGCK